MFYAAQGGVSTYLTAKASWIAQHTQIDHVIVAPSHGGRSDAHLLRVPSLPIPGNATFRMPRSITSTSRVLRRLQPDLIEVGDPYQCAWAALRLKRERDVPLIIFHHSDLVQLVGSRFGQHAAMLATRYLVHLYREFDLVLTPSEVMAQRLRDIGIQRAQRQPLGVDTRVFSPTARDVGLRRALRLAPDTRLLVYAGRFSREKRLDLLIQAVAQLGAPYHLLLIGGDEYGPPAPHVTCLPFQHDAIRLARLLASCDLLVHGGDAETFGLVVLEAMACGLPVLGVAAGGVAELVDADTGLLVAPNRVDLLAEGIVSLFERDLAQLGINARHKVQQHYDWNIIVPQMMARYASLLAVYERIGTNTRSDYAIE